MRQWILKHAVPIILSHIFVNMVFDSGRGTSMKHFNKTMWRLNFSSQSESFTINH